MTWLTLHVSSIQRIISCGWGHHHDGREATLHFLRWLRFHRLSLSRVMTGLAIGVLIRGQPIVAQHESGCGTSRHLGAAQLLGRFRSEADINPGEGSQNRIYEYTALNFHRAGSRDPVTGSLYWRSPETVARDRKMQALCDAADAAGSARLAKLNSSTMTGSPRIPEPR